MNNTVGAADLGKWLGVSSQSVAAFANDGRVVRISRGKYDLKASIQAYTSHLREVAAARGGEVGVLDLVQERARLAKEQADGHKMKNATLRRELLPRDEVEAEWTDIVRKLRSGMLAIPSRIRQRLSLDAIATAEIDRQVRDVLTVLGNDQEIEADGATSADPACAH